MTRFFASLADRRHPRELRGRKRPWRSRPLWDQSLEVIDRMLAVNLRAAISSVARSGAEDDRAGFGRIISVGSIIGSAGKARFADYAAAKAGLTGYMKSAAIELGPFGITVNLVLPASSREAARQKTSWTA